jgi:hypothetical protein
MKHFPMTGPMSPDDITIDPSALLKIRQAIHNVLDRHGLDVVDSGQYTDGSLAEIYAENDEGKLIYVAVKPIKGGAW